MSLLSPLSALPIISKSGRAVCEDIDFNMAFLNVGVSLLGLSAKGCLSIESLCLKNLVGVSAGGLYHGTLRFTSYGENVTHSSSLVGKGGKKPLSYKYFKNVPALSSPF